jgi:hypothetical protein
LLHWAEFYDSNPAIQSIWTRGSFIQLLKTKRQFFGDDVVSLRNGTFLRESFSTRLNEWLALKKPNNLHKAPKGD